MLIIRKLRLQRGWSQAELAQFSGLSIRTIQRVEKGRKPGLETLKSLAAVFDLEAADFQQEESIMDDWEVSREEREAFEYVKKLKEFYGHLFSYIFIMSAMFLFNYFTSPGYFWVKWPAMGWGIGLSAHAFRVFGHFSFFGPDWEKRKVEKILGHKL